MKNKLLVLGATLVVASPIAFSISCGNNPNQQLDKAQMSNAPTNAFSVNGKTINVQEDGIYLLKNDYQNGKIWNGQTLSRGAEAADDIVKLGETQIGLTNSLMLGDGDSIYVLYDKDSSDKMTPETFNKNLYFIDTSIASDLMDENVKIGNIKTSDGWGSNLITFIQSTDESKGKLNAYFGSQSNHMSQSGTSSNIDDFNNAILNLQKTIGSTYPDSLQKVLDYYGVMFDANGKVVPNPSITNHASLVFAPVFSSQPIFTYERVAYNAFKITYHFDGNTRITAAHFEFDASDNSDGSQYGSLSLGDKQEWDSYIRHQDAKYQAIKDIYISK